MNYNDIDRIVARTFKIKVSTIHSNSHKVEVIFARAAAIKLSHDLLKYSFNRLSKVYNKRSHNTAGNAYRVAGNMYDTDPEFRALFDQARNKAKAFLDGWKPRKQRYNLHYRLREKEISVDNKSRTVSISPDQEHLISRSGQLAKLLKQHNYSVQYSIL